MESKSDVIRVECCAECPFKTAGNKCKHSDAVEIDVETMEDDLPTLCPMHNGAAWPHEDTYVMLADWILKQYPGEIED